MVKKWQRIFLIQGCVVAVTAIAIIVYPESPRFHLVKGKEKEAKETFRRISKIFKTGGVSENVELTYTDYDQNYLAQVKDFTKYPLMLRNTAVLMACWVVKSCLSFGLLFSWSKLGSDIYTSIFFAELSSFIAKVTGMVYFIIHYFGRKKAVMINFAGIGLIFFLSVPIFGVHISETWTLEQVACLCTIPFIEGVWSSVALLTKELSPTSHRGMIYCMCSAVARIGSFVGPYLALLYNTMDHRIVLSIFGGIAALTSFLAYFNSDSTGKPIPSTPEDLQDSKTRHKITRPEND